MAKSGDPRKQERPDGRLSDQALDRASEELTRAVPPTITGMITAFGAEAVPSRVFRGQKALELQLPCGLLIGKFRVAPDFADTLCEAIRDAAREARSGLEPAALTDIPKAKAVTG